MNRLLIILPLWLQARDRDWTGHRHWLRYTVVMDRGALRYDLIGRAWTFSGALDLWDAARNETRKYVHFIVEPWWRRPFRRDQVARRHLWRYRLVRKPVGANLDQCRIVSEHRTWRAALDRQLAIR